MNRFSPTNSRSRCRLGRLLAEQRHGFVILELLAYVALLGVLAGSVAVSSRMIQEGSGVQRVESKLGWLDAAARRAAETSTAPVTLQISLAEQELTMQVGGQTPLSSSYRITWPRELKLQQAWVSRRSVVLGEASARFGGGGLSETYGLEFYDRRNAKSVWLLTAGGSGQVQRLRDRASMKEVFDALSRRDFD